jgi:Sulfatase
MPADGNTTPPFRNRAIYDDEHYILEAQHCARWAAEVDKIDQKLAALRAEAPPNIIHIMCDDIALDEVGIPAIQKVGGFETPNINRLTPEGINFARMYSEPSCTPSRVAVLTRRHPVRNGMYSVAFSQKRGGGAAILC